MLRWFLFVTALLFYHLSCDNVPRTVPAAWFLDGDGGKENILRYSTSTVPERFALQFILFLTERGVRFTLGVSFLG